MGRSRGGDLICGAARFDRFFEKIEKLKTQRYILVAVDLADRTMYTAQRKSKTAEETLRAFKEFIADNAGVMPGICLTWTLH